MKYNTKQLNRIKEMESAMERVLDTMALYKPFTDSIREDPKKLKHYYETDWMKDFESDEKGEPVVSIAPSSLLMLLSPTRVIRPVRFVMIIRSELPFKIKPSSFYK